MDQLDQQIDGALLSGQRFDDFLFGHLCNYIEELSNVKVSLLQALFLALMFGVSGFWLRGLFIGKTKKSSERVTPVVGDLDDDNLTVIDTCGDKYETDGFTIASPRSSSEEIRDKQLQNSPLPDSFCLTPATMEFTEVEQSTKPLVTDSPAESLSAAVSALKLSYQSLFDAKDLDELGKPYLGGKSKSDLRVSLVIVAADRADEERFNREGVVGFIEDMNCFGGSTVEIGNLPSDAKVALVRGMPGTGKTSLCHHLLSEWIDGHIWKGTYDLVFYVNCRELLVPNDPEAAFDLAAALGRLYPQVFECLSFKDITDLGLRCLIIADSIDGVDINLTCSCRVKCKLPLRERILFEIITNQVFAKVLLGRPAACYQIQRRFLLDVPFHHLEVLGFSELQAKEYVHKFYWPDTQKADSTWNKLRETTSLFSAVHVPVLNNILCSVLCKDRLPVTETELYVWLFIGFIFRHRGNTNANRSFAIANRLNYGDVLTELHAICDLAYKNLLKRNSLLEPPENSADELFVSSFMVRGKKHFAFNNFALVEFFASIKILLRDGEIADLFHSPNFGKTLAIYSGLLGASLRNSNSPHIIIEFMQPLLQKFNTPIAPEHPLAKESVASELWRLDKYLYFQICFEFQNEHFSWNLYYEEEMLGKNYAHYQLERCLYFVRHCVKDGSKVSFGFSPADGLITDGECSTLVDAATSHDRTNLRVHINLLDFSACRLDDGNMEILSQVLVQAETVDLSNNELISAYGWKNFAECARLARGRNSFKVNHLLLCRCNLTDESMEALSSIIPLVAKVDLRYNMEVTEGWVAFLSSLWKAHEENLLQLREVQVDDDLQAACADIFEAYAIQVTS